MVASKKRTPRLRDAQMESQGWLTVKSAVSLVGMSKSSIYRFVETGQLKHAKVGASIYISHESLLKLLPPARPSVA